MGVNPGHPPRPASAPAARPRRPQSAPANRPSAAPLERAPRRSHAHRRRAPQPREPHASPERQRQEIGELKVKVNDLTSQLLSARARAARLDGQVVAQAKQIETLLASRGRADRGAASPEGARRAPETVAVRTVRSQHERSMIVRRLREQLDRLREDLADRDDEVARLARSQRGTALLEVEAAKEEYYAEVLRLRRQLETARDDRGFDDGDHFDGGFDFGGGDDGGGYPSADGDGAENDELDAVDARMRALLRDNRDLGDLGDVVVADDYEESDGAPSPRAASFPVEDDIDRADLRLRGDSV